MKENIEKDYPNLIYAITNPKEFYEKAIENYEKYGSEASTLEVRNEV